LGSGSYVTGSFPATSSRSTADAPFPSRQGPGWPKLWLWLWLVIVLVVAVLALTILLHWLQDNHVYHVNFWMATLNGFCGRLQA
jgi:polyferredoxin